MLKKDISEVKIALIIVKATELGDEGYPSGILRFIIAESASSLLVAKNVTFNPEGLCIPSYEGEYIPKKHIDSIVYLNGEN